MRLFSPLFAIFLSISLLEAADPTPVETKKEMEKSSNFDIPIPLGIPVKGIKIPHRNEEGKLVMTIEAEIAKKIDAQYVEMENMKIASFDDEGKPIYIELPHSIFHLETRILTGDSHALIRREDFEITGDSLEFHSKTRHATLRGKIHMIIQSTHIEQ